MSNASGKVAVSSVTSTELGYLSGVTSAIQTQLDGKAVAANLATVATSGSYTDLTNKPTIGTATITFKKDGATISGQSFDVNATSDVEIDLGDTGKVDDVKINNASIVSNKVANIPIVGNNIAGVVVGDGGIRGINFFNSGNPYIVRAIDDEVTAKTSSFKPLTPINIDLATKVGLTTNTIPLLDSEKVTACNWLGAAQETVFVDWEG